PVPYRMANVPQAWAAGSVLHMVRILLGLEPDMPAGRIYLDPALPAWCSRLELRKLRLGRHEVWLSVERRPDGQHAVDADTEGGRGAGGGGGGRRLGAGGGGGVGGGRRWGGCVWRLGTARGRLLGRGWRGGVWVAMNFAFLDCFARKLT